MKRKHDRGDIADEIDAKAAAAAEGEVSERTLAEEDGVGADDAAARPEAPAADDGAKDRLVGELKDALLRQMAEFENYRRRTDREKERIHADAVADVASAFLPVLDSLERAVAAADAASRDGIAQVLRQAGESLARIRVEEIPALGQPFDPGVHHAVQHVEDETLGAGVVVEVYQKGYRCGDRVVRHSMVKVAN